LVRLERGLEGPESIDVDSGINNNNITTTTTTAITTTTTTSNSNSNNDSKRNSSNSGNNNVLCLSLCLGQASVSVSSGGCVEALKGSITVSHYTPFCTTILYVTLHGMLVWSSCGLLPLT
jgi:hypothetical protein